MKMNCCCMDRHIECEASMCALLMEHDHLIGTSHVVCNDVALWALH